MKKIGGSKGPRPRSTLEIFQPSGSSIRTQGGRKDGHTWREVTGLGPQKSEGGVSNLWYVYHYHVCKTIKVGPERSLEVRVCLLTDQLQKSVHREI